MSVDRLYPILCCWLNSTRAGWTGLLQSRLVVRLQLIVCWWWMEAAAGSCPLRRPQVRLGSATLFTVHLVFVQLRFDLQRLPLRPLPLPRSLFSNHCCRGRCCYCCRSPSTHRRRRIALLDFVAARDAGPIPLWLSWWSSVNSRTGDMQILWGYPSVLSPTFLFQHVAYS